MDVKIDSAKAPADPAAKVGTTGHEWDGIRGAQYAVAALVAVAVLRDHHLVDRVLGGLSGLAARLLL